MNTDGEGCGIFLIFLVGALVIGAAIHESWPKGPKTFPTYETVCPKCGTKVVLIIKTERHTVPLVMPVPIVH